MPSASGTLKPRFCARADMSWISRDLDSCSATPAILHHYIAHALEVTMPIVVAIVHAVKAAAGWLRHPHHGHGHKADDAVDVAAGGQPAAAAPPPPAPPLSPPAVHPHAALIEQLSRQPPLLQVPPHPLPVPLPPLGSGQAEYELVDRPCRLASAAMELYEQVRCSGGTEGFWWWAPVCGAGAGGSVAR